MIKKDKFFIKKTTLNSPINSKWNKFNRSPRLKPKELPYIRNENK